MEFKGQYLTYQEFKALGGTLDEMPFNLLEYNARIETIWQELMETTRY